MKIALVKNTVLIIALAILTSACNETKKGANKETLDNSPHGIILENMDTSVNPKDDFYSFVNGNWEKTTQIPDDQTRWGGFGVLRKKTDADMLAILDKAQKSNKYEASTDQAKAMMIFESELNTDARNKAGISPLKPALEIINSISSFSDFQEAITKYPTAISQPFFGIAAFSDPSNSAMNTSYLFPGGLGLPERDYYLKTDSISVKTREDYVSLFLLLKQN